MKTAFKCQKNVPKMSGDIFVDICLTFCRSPAGPQDIFFTFLRHFVGDPQNEHQDILDSFLGKSRKTPIGTVLHIMAAGRLSFCPEVAISGHQSRKSEPQLQKSKPTSRLLTSPQLTSPYLTSPQLTSTHLSSPHLTSRHLTSPHVIATATHPSFKESTQGGGAKRRPPAWIPSRKGV